MDISPASTTPIAIRLNTVLCLLRATLGRFGLEAVCAVLLFQHIGVVIRRIDNLLRRFQAGRLRPGTARKTPAAITHSRKPAQRLPRRAGWLLAAGKHQAAVFTVQLQSLLNEPEMAEMLAASPQAVRLLRPLCRMLAVDVPIMRPPARPAREPKPRKPRTRRPMPDLGRIPLPRGVLTAARRQGFGKW